MIEHYIQQEPNAPRRTQGSPRPASGPRLGHRRQWPYSQKGTMKHE